MTFYSTKIINRGFTTLNECYMGQWVDADLGNYADDYVGCDVGRGLCFCYNGDDDDEGVLGYGLNPPTIGVDYFEGPTDTAGNQMGLSHFMYSIIPLILSPEILIVPILIVFITS